MTAPLGRRPLLRAGAAASSLLLARPLPALARQNDPLIVMVIPRAEASTEVGFRDYFDRRGRRVRIEVLNTEGDAGRIPGFIERIREMDADLVYTWGTPTTLAVAGRHDEPDPQGFITERPVVFCTVTNAAGSGIVASNDRPGRNVTGTSHIPPLGVQINTIAAYHREIDRLGAIYNPREINSTLTIEALAPFLAERQIAFDARPVPDNADGEPDIDAVPGMVEALARDGADFLYIGPDTFVAVHAREPLTRAAISAGLPTFSATETIVRRSNALLGLFSAGLSVGRFTALKAEQVLFEQADPATMPVETLQRFSLLINMPVARRIEAYPPLTLLDLAEIIE